MIDQIKNYFENFSFNVDFNIDLEELENKYLEFQKQFHPDNSISADVEKSISINEAYKVLKNPLQRASHILQLNGIDLENDSIAQRLVDALAKTDSHAIGLLREEMYAALDQMQPEHYASYIFLTCFPSIYKAMGEK
jgi:Fe-S protein assembly co-chaperone HscB